ncbi:MAG TPA: hypothetical protein ENJ09_07525, partial [Planctomycetes bacterium]|nr:hypothetical protein [Planctomycetota bacterium]
DPTDGTWSHRAYVKASNTGAGDGFGISAALFGDTLVVGAPDEKSNATGINGNQGNNFLRNAGAAYCFRRSPQDGSWAQHAYIKASNTGHTDRFGNAVAVSGNRALVGARQEESAATGVNGSEEDNSAFQAGAAYSFLLEASQKASATVRLGSPANPNALLAGSSPGPILGSTWDPRIDHSSFFPGATTDLLLISPQGPINQPLSIGTLLCSLARPRTLLSTPAGVPFTLPIPLDCTLLGLNACAQGASLGTGMTRLTNALDIVLGAY